MAKKKWTLQEDAAWDRPGHYAIEQPGIHPEYRPQEITQGPHRA